MLLSPREVEGEYAVPVSWSRHERTLAFYLGTPAGPQNLWFLPTDGRPREVFATSYDDRSPAVSPDGGWLAYVSDESGEDEVYVLPTGELGTRVTASTNCGTEPVSRSDGCQLFYRSADDLMAVAFDPVSGAVGAPECVITGRPDLLRTPQGNPNYDVSPDGRRFLMIQQVVGSGPIDLQVVLNWDEELRARVPAVGADRRTAVE